MLDVVADPIAVIEIEEGNGLRSVMANEAAPTTFGLSEGGDAECSGRVSRLLSSPLRHHKQSGQLPGTRNTDSEMTAYCSWPLSGC